MRTKEISVQAWHELSMAGEKLPIRFCVDGESMTPFIRKQRDKVTIWPIEGPLRVGDIVLYRDEGSPERYVLHRIWKISGGQVQTFGDGCLRPDPWMPQEAVWGKAICIDRGALQIHLDDPRWALVFRVWCGLWPVRKWLFWPRRAYRGIRHRVQQHAEENG